MTKQCTSIWTWNSLRRVWQIATTNSRSAGLCFLLRGKNDIPILPCLYGRAVPLSSNNAPPYCKDETMPVFQSGLSAIITSKPATKGSLGDGWDPPEPQKLKISSEIPARAEFDPAVNGALWLARIFTSNWAWLAYVLGMPAGRGGRCVLTGPVCGQELPKKVN